MSDTIDLKSLNNKSFALILWGKKGSDDDVAVFSGKAIYDAARLFIELKGNPKFEIVSEWQSRIKKTDSSIKDIVASAEYCLNLSVGDIDDTAENKHKFQSIGLVWPK